MFALTCAASGAIAEDAAETACSPLRAVQIADDFELVQIAKDVYAFVSNNTTHFWEDGNTTVILTEDGALVVDASTTYLSQRHLAEIRKLTDEPIRYVVNTHWHRDHLMGNHVYKDAYPDVRIVAQNYGALISDRRDPPIMEKVFKGQEGKDLVRGLKGGGNRRGCRGNRACRL
ncbi:MAG: MBL fold metallo-hydrolase [Gammaproteobacteria bacterium]